MYVRFALHVRFGVLRQLDIRGTLFTFLTKWTILKRNVPSSFKSQSANRWRSRIHCISPLRYHLVDVLKAMKVLESYYLEKAMVKQLIMFLELNHGASFCRLSFGMNFFFKLTKPAKL